MSSRLAKVQWIVFAVLSAALVTARGSQAAPTAAMQEQIIPYLTAQQLVQIDKGRAINLVCLGQGTPTVVPTAGLTQWSVWWWAVQLPVARKTRVCAWDPAGYGFSTPSPQPQVIW
jgi:pimeloyl-ACP methyl ester carboxylesterase